VPPRKKYTKKISYNFTPEINKYIAITVFVFFWVLSLIADVNSTFGYYIYETLDTLFWVYYKFIFSPIVLLLSVFLIKDKTLEFNSYRFIWLIIYLSSITTLVWFFFTKYPYAAYFNMYSVTDELLWRGATWFSFLLLFIVSLIILFRFNPILFIQSLFENIPNIKDSVSNSKNEKKSPVNVRKEAKMEKKQKELDDMLIKLQEEKKSLAKSKQSKQLNLGDVPKKIRVEKKSPSIVGWLFNKKTPKKEEVTIKRNPEFKNWEFPDINLLSNIWWTIKYDENEIRRKEIEIQEKLLQFKIEVEMVGYKVWPTVIQFRLKPKAWVALKKIISLQNDLTLALHAKSIRIQAPIPGLWVVWIEVPNPNRQAVWLKEILSSKSFNSKKTEIPIAIWKDVNWDLIVWDLAEMPHLLVAWQTKSGKSVWMNWFLISLLYKFSPSELKMIMIDPKQVELSVYDWIPHLLTPVITNPDKALNSLKWSVAEMLRRYSLAKKVWARNLQEYNENVWKDEKLPYIVIVIDELSDLMMSWNKKEVESAIVRISQMARAVWMHLIIATQRPSVDVITWLIKANIPSRIAFTVASQIDSQTVISKKWAEDLLWKWDMLYYPTWAMAPERVQWVLVETNEVKAVVNKLKLTIDPDMLNNMQISEIVNWKSKLEWSILENYKWDQEESPEIIEKAIQVVKDAKKWSTSLIQRKLWLWYARAAKVLDILEELWVVWPSNWSKPREVYVD